MSDILSQWRQGQGLPDTLVIDGHGHIGEWPHAATFPNHSVEEAAEEAVAFMDANGLDLFCSQSGGYMLDGSDYRLGNDYLLDVWRLIPDRLIPFANVNPNDSRENILAELDRVYEAGIRCLKLINDYQDNYPPGGPNMMAVYEYASQRAMLILNHGWRDSEALNSIADEFPAVDFITGHYGWRQDETLKAHPNVFANIWGYGSMGWLDHGFREVGAHKFILGSDGFLNPLSGGIGPVVFAPISDEEKRLVLGLTMGRLLHKRGVLPDWVEEKWGAQIKGKCE